MKHRLHVVKVPTAVKGLFPYSHYADAGHSPTLELQPAPDGIRLLCADVFKLKPNVQRSPRTRIDMYMPGDAAMGLAAELVPLVGRGRVARAAGVDPNDFRAGPQSLPIIAEARQLWCARADVSIAGLVVTGGVGTVYLDRESPNEGHVEMKGPEVHIGVPLRAGVSGSFDPRLVQRIEVPAEELRVAGERNPVPKAIGIVRIEFDLRQAADLAATLLRYGS